MNRSLIGFSIIIAFILFILGISINQEVRNGFLANIFSDVIIGIIFTVIISYWVNIKINQYQRNQYNLDERKRIIGNAIQYLELIRIEIEKVVKQIPNDLLAYSIVGDPIPANVNIATPLWNLLQPSGELPKVMDPILLSEIANCHGLLNESRRWLMNFQEVINRRQIPRNQIDEMATQITGRFQEVKELASIISPKIPGEINRLKLIMNKLK